MCYIYKTNIGILNYVSFFEFYIVLKWKSIALEADRTQEKNNLSTFVRLKERNDAILLQI
jgi:hypothetical protein